MISCIMFSVASAISLTSYSPLRWFSPNKSVFRRGPISGFVIFFSILFISSSFKSRRTFFCQPASSPASGTAEVLRLLALVLADEVLAEEVLIEVVFTDEALEEELEDIDDEDQAVRY